MKKEDVIDVYKTRIKKLSQFYQKTAEQFTVNDIHHFRVELKKLRAFIRLVNQATPAGQQKIPRELKKFYNAVGHLRNLQLHEKRIGNLAAELLMETRSGIYNT